MAARALGPMSALSTSVGSSRQPSTRRFSSTASSSMRLVAAAALSGSVGRNAVPTAYAPAGGSSKSTTARRKASGTWMRMPTPSPVLYSAPRAPRCSRRRSAARPRRTISWVRRPVRSATSATPHASCSCSGEYMPAVAATARSLVAAKSSSCRLNAPRRLHRDDVVRVPATPVVLIPSTDRGSSGCPSARSAALLPEHQQSADRRGRRRSGRRSARPHAASRAVSHCKSRMRDRRSASSIACATLRRWTPNGRSQRSWPMSRKSDRSSRSPPGRRHRATRAGYLSRRCGPASHFVLVLRITAVAEHGAAPQVGSPPRRELPARCRRGSRRCGRPWVPTSAWPRRRLSRA